MGHRRSAASWQALALTLLVIVLALVCVPSRALARDYGVSRVDADLTVGADGSLTVSESRTFDFDGAFNGVYWDISTAQGEGADTRGPAALEVTSVSEVMGDEARGFDSNTSGAPGTYELIPQGDTVTRVKIYAPHEDESATIRVTYRIVNVASAWADTAEFNWKFVSDGWEVASDNVTARIHLPVPAGESVTPGENVRAWGHGPLDASLAFDGNDVVYTVPGVGTDEFAEATIVFPAAWLTGVTPSSQPMLQTILDREQAAADEANARREQARVLIGAGFGVSIASGVAALVSAVVLRRRWKRRHEPQFQDDYFRDVPSEDHPAVLGALYAGGEVGNDLLTATIMRLCDRHALSLDVARDAKGRERDHVITRKTDTDPEDRVDAAAMSLLFDTVAHRAAAERRPRKVAEAWEQLAASGVDSSRALLFSDMKRVAESSPTAYGSAIDSWSAEVKAQMEARGLFVDASGTGRGPLMAILAIAGVAGGISAIALLLNGAPGMGAVALLVTLAGCGIGGILAGGMRPLSPEAVELTAKLKALRKWLTEFTLLKEAVPRDVILWNRLLVMAVALGVANDVIKQLKVAAPEILEDPGFYPMYYWYFGYGHLGRPAAAFSEAVESAHTVSTAALAKSSDSSGAGLGGGFSGGGGFGGGGGGGGGAF